MYVSLLVFCAIDHMLITSVFVAFKAWILTGLNIGLVLAHLVMALIAKKSDLRIIGTIAYCMTGVHSVLATLGVGWDYGFALYLICIVPLAFYIPYKRMRTSCIIAFTSVAAFTLLRFYVAADGFTPYGHVLSDIKTIAVNGIYIFNSIASFILLVVISIVYNVSNKRAQAELERKNAKLRELAYTDPLTKLKNRRSMFSAVKESFKSAQQNGTAFTVLLADIDDFKKVNDSYGHNCGDFVLTEISRIFEMNVPEEASVCRWGGEEILVLLPECKTEKGAEIADGIRMAVDNRIFEHEGKNFRVSITVGVCENSGNLTADKMISKADKNLYSGKNSGKNCVVY